MYSFWKRDQRLLVSPFPWVHMNYSFVGLGSKYVRGIRSEGVYGRRAFLEGRFDLRRRVQFVKVYAYVFCNGSVGGLWLSANWGYESFRQHNLLQRVLLDLRKGRTGFSKGKRGRGEVLEERSVWGFCFQVVERQGELESWRSKKIKYKSAKLNCLFSPRHIQRELRPFCYCTTTVLYNITSRLSSPSPVSKHMVYSTNMNSFDMGIRTVCFEVGGDWNCLIWSVWHE